MMYIFSLFLFLLIPWPVGAQTEHPDAVAAIDLLLDLPEDQKIAILEENKEYERVRLVLRIAQERIDKAKLAAVDRPSESVAEIENYNKLIQYVRLYIGSLLETPRERKMFFKILEVTLREHLVFLKEFEKSLDEPYASAIMPAIDNIKNCRTEALNTLFGSRVLVPPDN
jgi:hypothetical protein